MQAALSDAAAVQELEIAHKRASFLARAGSVLASSLDYETTLRTVAGLIVPEIADWCLIDLFEEDGSIRPLVIAHSEPEKAELARKLRYRFPPHVHPDAGVALVKRTGKAELYHHITDQMLTDQGIETEQRRILRKLGLTSAMCVPLAARGRVLGAITFASSSQERLYDDDDLEFGSHIADRAAMAVENARLFGQAEEAIILRDQAVATLTIQAKQQAAVAELGQKALEGTGLEQLMEQALDVVFEMLKIDFCKILELKSDGRTLLLRAGRGWREGLVGNWTTSITNSQSGYALLTGRPVFIEDLKTETMFAPSEILESHGVVSGLSVIIQGQGRPFGVLSVHTRTRRLFTRDEMNFLRSLANVFGTAVERLEAERERNALLKREQESRALSEQAERESTFLSEASRVLATSLDYEQTLENIARLNVPKFADYCIVYSFTEEGDLRQAAAVHADEQKRQLLKRVSEIRKEIQLVAEDVVRTCSTQWNPYAGDHAAARLGFGSHIGVPMVVRDQVVGAIVVVFSESGRRHAERDVAVMEELARRGALAVDNAHLYQHHKTAEETILTQLHEKEVLLREIHHRVKNNMQVISSLLSLEYSSADTQTREKLRESQNRIQSMALVHEKLYESKNLSRVDLGKYIEELASMLYSSYRVSRDRISLNLECDNATVNIDRAIPCGLILNELISNALKHAFVPDQQGSITVRLMSTNERFRLEVSDNGRGIPREMELEKNPHLGLRLVSILVKQLSGTYQLDTTGGTHFVIEF